MMVLIAAVLCLACVAGLRPRALRSGVGNRALSSGSVLHCLPSDTADESIPHICVVGAGWAGWGAARSLLHAGARVTLVDAANDPTGELGTTTPTGKPFDAGQKGFWRDYPNIYGMLPDLKLEISDVLTPCTNSSFYSPYGLEATAPVFGDSPRLPSPLGQIAASAALFERLPLADRASVAGLLVAILDLNAATTRIYDCMTAKELFDRFGLSKRLVDDFLRPTLLVGLFKPPEELSAAVVMELLFFYALSHQDSFDVRWIKKGSVASSFFLPLHRHLSEQYPGKYSVKGNSAVREIEVADGMVRSVRLSTLDSSTKQVTDSVVRPDGIVLAVGAKGLRAILSQSPTLTKSSAMLSRAATMGSIDCIAVRLWLDKKVATRSPANVFASFPELRGAGGTFFMLDQLQPDEDALWGGKKKDEEESRGSVFSCDFYNADALMYLSDEDIVALLLEKLLPVALPSMRQLQPKVVDSYVKRYPGAVNLFAPNTFNLRPRINDPAVKNLKVAGDWTWMEDLEPKSKGLCQERAFVSGMEAANAMMTQLNGQQKNLAVLPVRDDEIQVELGRTVTKAVTSQIFQNPLLKVFGGLLFARRE